MNAPSEGRIKSQKIKISRDGHTQNKNEKSDEQQTSDVQIASIGSIVISAAFTKNM